jgi:hypothetical protein
VLIEEETRRKDPTHRKDLKWKSQRSVVPGAQHRTSSIFKEEPESDSLEPAAE